MVKAPVCQECDQTPGRNLLICPLQHGLIVLEGETGNLSVPEPFAPPCFTFTTMNQPYQVREVLADRDASAIQLPISAWASPTKSGIPMAIATGVPMAVEAPM